MLPPCLAARVTAANPQPSATYTVILFAHNPEIGGVATSSQVKKALGKVAAEDPILVAGHDFTVEATELLEDRGAIVVRRGEYGWTDDSYRRLREQPT
jgi:hypothetical protein